VNKAEVVGRHRPALYRDSADVPTWAYLISGDGAGHFFYDLNRVACKRSPDAHPRWRVEPAELAPNHGWE
jgi:hypothetical protein